MNKFKVGDSVKVVKLIKGSSQDLGNYEETIGKTGKIIHDTGFFSPLSWQYRVDFDDLTLLHMGYDECNLELVPLETKEVLSEKVSKELDDLIGKAKKWDEHELAEKVKAEGEKLKTTLSLGDMFVSGTGAWSFINPTKPDIVIETKSKSKQDVLKAIELAIGSNYTDDSEMFLDSYSIDDSDGNSTTYIIKIGDVDDE